jgi:WD repeat and SOF domain-containing protein 1
MPLNRGVDHHRNRSIFATSGGVVNVWDHNRSEPIHQFSWGSETINTVKFNQSEVDVFASSGSDRSITLYDIRSDSPLAKLVMEVGLSTDCVLFIIGNNHL